MSVLINPPLDSVFCPQCKLVTCICQVKATHKEGCRYLRAARLSVEIPCEHGAQACPICDPCTCGVGATQPIF